jgi:YD repeat-containing protein
MGEYLPVAPVNDEAKKHNGNLPGMGGVFNYVNLHAYHYAGNNPVKYVDPDGRDSIWNIDEQSKTIEITIPVDFKGATEDQKQEFYAAAKDWEGEFTINMGLARGNLTDFTGVGTYTVTVKVVEIKDGSKKYEGVNVNTVTFSPFERDDNKGLIPYVERDRNMTLYVQDYLKRTIIHEIGHLFGLVNRYYEKKDKDGNRDTISHFDWEFNRMGSEYGLIQGRNFDEGLTRSANRRVFKQGNF